MPQLEFTVSADDEQNFAAVADIQRNMYVDGTKNMIPAADPSVDSSIVNPEEAFRIE